ncbi:hypothetical protein, partial [Streptomyces spongiae]|uniref:hypothetical protein n=1 Tax=Streptomyces spongiae TaxID=565072 RepID=UPI001D13CB89
MGAIAIRLGTVRPLIETGRDRIAAAREAEAASVTVELLGEVDDIENVIRIPDGMCIRIHHPPRST